MIGLIKGKNTGFKLFNRFHGPEHGVQKLIIKGLPNIELNNSLRLGQMRDNLSMINPDIIVYIVYLILIFAIPAQNDPHKMIIVLDFVLGQQLNGPVEVNAVEGGLGLVSVGQFEEVGELALTLAFLQAAVDLVYRYLLLELLLGSG